MFATLAGGYPAADPTDRAPSPSAADVLVREILAEQAPSQRPAARWSRSTRTTRP